ncbi:MAG: Bug family tripartite tricarboxylate transporter substrate binding protein [Burkholderiaceae bacterium]
MNISRRQAVLAGAAMLGAFGGRAAAQQASAGDFPSRTIRLTVPYAPGGGTDLVMRAIAPGMADMLGQPVVIENKPGGGTITATQLVARAAPDGYSLLAVGAPIYLNTALGIKTPYDPLTDLVPLSLLVNNPGLLLVAPNLEVKTVKDLVALSKARKGSLSYASAGNGSISHLGGELLKSQLGLDMVHVPYKGSAPALADLMGGQVPVAVDALIPSGAQVKAGKVRALAILSKERSALLPDVPTIAEAGFPPMDIGGTFGLMLPAKTPPAIIAKLHAAMMKSISNPATRKQLDEMGYQVIANTPEQFGSYLRDQIAMWTKIVKDHNIKAE